MNNPNFRSLGEFDGYPSGESNDGAPIPGDKDKEKPKKRKGSTDNEARASAPRRADDVGSEVVKWFRRKDEDAKQPPKEEVVIFSARSEKPEAPEMPEASSVESDDTAELADQQIELNTAEQQEVVAAYIEASSEAVQAEYGALAAGDGLARSEVQANQAFLHAATRELRKPASPDTKDEQVSQAIDAAFEDVEQQIAQGADLGKTAEQDAKTSNPQTQERATPGVMQYEDVESSSAQSLSAYAAAQAPPVNAAAGGMPPHRYGASYGAMGGANMAPGFMQTGNVNMAPATQDERGPRVADWFVPAAVAYLWGRHNGRKKAERRLIPQQKKLETTVRELVADVAAKEARIRHIARQQAELRAAQEAAAAVPQRPAEASARPQANEGPRVEPSPSVAPRPVAEVAPAAPTVPAEQHAAERFATPTSVEAAPAAAVSQVEAAPRQKTPPEVMTHQELLAASADIAIGPVDLRSIYEDNKISEEGLRRLVIEHHHGGDIRSILKDEMLKKEMSYEIDPLQKQDQQTPEAAPAQQPAQPLFVPWLINTPPPVLPQAPAPAVTPAEPIIDFEPSYSPKRLSRIPTETRRTVQPVLVAANVAAFVVLGVLVVALLIIWMNA